MPSDEIGFDSDSDLEFLEEFEKETEPEPKKPSKPLIQTKKATEDLCETIASDLTERFPEHFEVQKHWSLTLLSIIHKTEYRPHHSLVHNQKKYDADTVGDLQIVNNHLSVAVLQNLTEHVEEWVKNNPPVVEDVEINDNQETLSYNGHKVEIEEAASKNSEGWASW